MKKILSRIMVTVMAFTAVLAFASCAAGKTAVITSNWKFDSMKSGGKTTKASDLKEDDIPMIIIDADKQNQDSYYVTYRQNGKNHNASMDKQSDGSYRIDYVDSDKDMIARVKGETLTLTIEGNSDITIVFKYTNEEILIPVDDKTGPDYIKVKMIDNGVVEFTNESDDTYMYGRFYQLEVQKDGKWCYARYVDHFAWTLEGVILSPGETNTAKYNLSYYGTLKPGEYRLAVGESNACLYAYFTVNADGSYTYAK